MWRYSTTFLLCADVWCNSEWHNIYNYDLPNIHLCHRFDETKEPFRCCGKEICLSLSDRVTKLLDPEILEIQVSLRYRDREDNCDLKPECFRFAAYRNLFVLVYGRSRAKMQRMPLPSCMVMRVRKDFPDPNNEYTGFRAKKNRKIWKYFWLQIWIRNKMIFHHPLWVVCRGATATDHGHHLRCSRYFLFSLCSVPKYVHMYR